MEYSHYGAVLKRLEKAVAGSECEENLLITTTPVFGDPIGQMAAVLDRLVQYWISYHCIRQVSTVLHWLSKH